MRQPTQASLDDLPEIDLTKAKLLGRGLRKDRKLPLRALREASDKTQLRRLLYFRSPCEQTGAALLAAIADARLC